ncbi:murein transglycosylase A [Azospira sp. I13]|uniref:murein transglycosylase A n=1 Tax=Azospira sp. I13 TaxID=1765050 RepID=UPI001F250B1A|nr:murein transglycosylase A [Azospira sp. I13]
MPVSQMPPRQPFLLLLAASLLLLGGCATPSRPPATAATAAGACPACPACPAPGAAPMCPPTTALPPPPAAKPLQAARWEDLPGWGEDDLGAAWPAFLQSCRGLVGKKEWALWRPACDEAQGLAASPGGKPDNGTLRRFFESRFQPYLLTNPEGTTEGMITGYYEPLLKGSRKPTGPGRYAVLGVPEDLLTIDLSELYPDLKNYRLRGRLVGNKVVPYWSRAELMAKEDREGRDGLKARTLLWVEDPIELFFLQIQGSGRVKLPDGGIVRLGYADQNGHPYQSIGRVLIERGDLKPEQASMQGIQAWARANPAKVNELLNANPSYVFFRELDLPATEGPIGALGVPLTPERSIAVDPRSTPLGAPVFLSATQPNSNKLLRRLVLAQDTGGAIKGVVRADYFWGYGAEAGALAGRMKQSGQMWVLLPPGLGPR